MTEEMYKKTIKDLQETLYTAYNRIKELTEQLEKIKKELIEIRLLLPENRETATEHIYNDYGQQDIEKYLQRVRKNEGQ